MTQYAFFVNSDACSGCKTCQVACKDKNNLPAGVHWRRVFEITGGGWEKKDGAWSSSVAAYNLSVACHHCLNPVCAAVCSVNAIWKREDGIVFIDERLCTRCRACRAACPYGAIQFDPVSTVSKCHFCVDLLVAGLAPACVSACPNRALDFGDHDELKRRYGTLARVFPLPDAAIAGPALVIRPHREAMQVQGRDPEVANWAEV